MVAQRGEEEREPFWCSGDVNGAQQGESVLRLHDATNAYLWMKHEVAKQAANEVAHKEIDKFYFDRRISLAVVTISARRAKLTSWQVQEYGLETSALRAYLWRQRAQQFSQNWIPWRRKGDYTLFACTNAPPKLVTRNHRICEGFSVASSGCWSMRA